MFFLYATFGKLAHSIFMFFFFRIEVTVIQKSCRFIAGVYTSKFTQKSSQNLGYKCYKEIMYTDYTDPLTNKQHFKDMQLHVSAKAMYFELKTL